jgi:hypothetical protein
MSIFIMGRTDKRVSAPARRQGDITTIAFMLLGGKEPAMAFLNTVSNELGARPIDLAAESDEGLAKVNRIIHRLANPQFEPK